MGLVASHTWYDEKLVVLICCRKNNEISVWNNGEGIPVVEHKVDKVYVPELIFGTLLTSSNFDDSQKKVTGRLFCINKHLSGQPPLLVGFGP